MSVEVNIAGEGCRLRLRELSWESPALTTGVDANWLRGEVELVASAAGRFSAVHAVHIRTEELERFRDELRALLQALDGEVVFEVLEAQFGGKVKLNAGTGSLEAFVTDHLGVELRVTDIRTDQSYLGQTLRELDAVVAEFGVRGDPWE